MPPVARAASIAATSNIPPGCCNVPQPRSERTQWLCPTASNCRWQSHCCTTPASCKPTSGSQSSSRETEAWPGRQQAEISRQQLKAATAYCLLLSACCLLPYHGATD